VTDKEPSKRRQNELETWLAGRVKAWGKPEKHDHECLWTKGANKELLEAGCIYEYTRESRNLRKLLFSMNESDHDGMKAKLVNPAWPEAARRGLQANMRWLIGFADELANNTSFEDLLRTKKGEVKQSLAKYPIHLPKLKGIDLAYPKSGDAGPPPWPWQPWSWSPLGTTFVPSDRPPSKVFNRPSSNTDGSEKIAVVIRWRDFTDSEIAAEMKRFADIHRPGSEPESKRKGQKPKDTIRSNIKALSVLRLRKLHERNWAAYKERRNRGRAREPMCQGAKSEMSNNCKRALSFFQLLSPGETPSNSSGVVRGRKS